MKKTIIACLGAAFVSVTGQASTSEKYPVPLTVSGVKVERVGTVLFRYIEFFEDYPCIRFETIQPVNHRLIDRVEACTFQINNSLIDVRRKDLAGVGYNEYRLDGAVFHFTADIIVGGTGPGIPPLSCSVSISEKGKLTAPSCKEKNRHPEPSVTK